MVSRKGFMAAIFGTLGAARAQQWKECTTAIPGTTSYVMPVRCPWPEQKQEPPLNNQCPTCGTMAEPYIRPLGAGNCIPVEGNLGVCAIQPGKLYGRMDALVRCKRCNAAFWQDAEK